MSFTTEGQQSFPHIYADYQQVTEYATWPDEALERKFHEYSEFLGQKDLMPRARDMANLVFTHLGFEITYRAINK